MKLNKAIISNPHDFDICNQSVSTEVPLPVGLLDENGCQTLACRGCRVHEQSIDHLDRIGSIIRVTIETSDDIEERDLGVALFVHAVGDTGSSVAETSFPTSCTRGS